MRRRDPKAAISGICGRDGTQLPIFFRRNPLILPETAKGKFGNPNFRALISLRSPKRNLAKSLEKAFFAGLWGRLRLERPTPHPPLRPSCPTDAAPKTPP